MMTEVVTKKQAKPGNLWKNIHCHIAIKTEVENKFSHESTEKLFWTTRNKWQAYMYSSKKKANYQNEHPIIFKNSIFLLKLGEKLS